MNCRRWILPRSSSCRSISRKPRPRPCAVRRGADHLQFSRLGQLRQDRIEALEPLDALRTLALMTFVELVAGLARHRADGRPDRVDRGRRSTRAGRRWRRCASMAALTAPHWLWPSTMMSLTPSSATANSMLPFTVGPAPLTMFPATRTTNRSPTPWSKISSGATRESAHADDDGEGRLPLRQRREVLRLPPRVGELPAHEPLVALEQPGEHRVRVAGRGRPGRRPAAGPAEGPVPAAPAASPVSRTNSRRDERYGMRMTKLLQANVGCPRRARRS